MDYRLKRLSAVDLALMKELLEVYGNAFGDLDTYTGATPSDEYLRRLLNRGGFITVVALHDEGVVGGLSAYVLEKFERERCEIYIYDLAVDERHRRRGVATALIAELRRIGGAIGAYVIFVQADPGDAPAIALYTGLGTREDVHHFDISTDGSS